MRCQQELFCADGTRPRERNFLTALVFKADLLLLRQKLFLPPPELSAQNESPGGAVTSFPA